MDSFTLCGVFREYGRLVKEFTCLVTRIIFRFKPNTNVLYKIQSSEEVKEKAAKFSRGESDFKSLMHECRRIAIRNHIYSLINLDGLYLIYLRY